MEKQLVLFAGLEPSEVESLRRGFRDRQPPLVLAPLLLNDSEHMLGAAIEAAMSEAALPGPSPVVATPYPIVLFAVLPQSEYGPFIETIKAVVPRRAVFAAATPTNITWTVAYLVEHLLEEHEHFLSLEAPARDGE